jgi:hypothetical protein
MNKKERMRAFLKSILEKKELTDKEKLIAYNSIEARKMLAESEIKEVLEMLADDWCVDVREAVARNPNTPISVLKEFAKHKYLRDAVYQNPKKINVGS